MSGRRAKSIRRELRRRGLDPSEKPTVRRMGKYGQALTRFSPGRADYRRVKRAVRHGGR